MAFADPKGIAESLLADVSWTAPDWGYCRCPGVGLHTHREGRRDCRVRLDRVPTIYCVHSSCRAVVAEANRALRRALGKAALAGNRGDWKSRPVTAEEIQRRRETEQKGRLEKRSKASLARILAEHRVGCADARESSPVPLRDDPRENWRLLLRLFPADGIVWIGDTKDSCGDEMGEARKAYCRTHFRAVRAWLAEAVVPGQFICPSLFRAGVHSRSNANVVGRPFLVVESDSLGKEAMLAVFAWMRQFMRLRAIVDTAGKSLHGWFDYPAVEQFEELRVILPALGFDPALFKAAQPCRLPGARRGDRIQFLLWLDLGERP